MKTHLHRLSFSVILVLFTDAYNSQACTVWDFYDLQ